MKSFHEVYREEKYQQIISAVKNLDMTERYELMHLKASIVLVDGSELHISEVWVGDELEKYSYYWLEETEKIIAGWDNAPHHPDIDTFPHHKHGKEGVEPSKPMNARVVLERLIDLML